MSSENIAVTHKPALLPKLLTKLAPPRFKKNLLHRARLVDTLLEQRESRLIIISSPAGYGKTTLLADYVNTLQNTTAATPYSWLTFDQSDRDPVVFIENLVLTISRTFPAFNAQQQFLPNLVEALQRPGDGLEMCCRLLVNQIYTTIQDQFELVLDDYHIVEDQPQLTELISLLLNYLPENCHVLFSCRSYLSLNLTDLVLQGEVVCLGVEELRLNQAEVFDLLNQKHGLSLSQKQAEELVNKTEGWVTGVLLCSNELLPTPAIETFGSQRLLFDYLATKIFQHLPGQLQQFLLDTSILSYLQADFCDRLLGQENSQQLLGECEGRQLYLSRIDNPEASQRSYYVLHNMFRDFLKKRLLTNHSERYRELHQRAAALYLEQGQIASMMEYLIQAEDYEALSRALEAYGPAELKAGHYQSVQAWLERLPPALLVKQPELRMLQATTLGQIGAYGEAHLLLDELESKLPTSQVDQDSFLHRLQIGLLRGKLLRNETRLGEAILTLKKVLEALEVSATPVTQQYSGPGAELYLELGICLGINGQYTLAIEALQNAYGLYKLLGTRERLAHVHQCLALTYNSLGERVEGRRQLEISLEYWRETGSIPGQVDALIILGGFYNSEGRSDQAIATFKQAYSQAHSAGYYNGAAYALFHTARLYSEQAQFEQATEQYREADRLAQYANDRRLGALVKLELVALCRLEGQTEEAARLLEAIRKTTPVQASNPTIITQLWQLAGAGLALDRQNLSEASMLLEALTASLTHLGQQYNRVLMVKRFLEARLLFTLNKHKPALRALVESVEGAAEHQELAVLKVEAFLAVPLLRFAQVRLSDRADMQRSLNFLLPTSPALPQSRALEVSLPELTAPEAIIALESSALPTLEAATALPLSSAKQRESGGAELNLRPNLAPTDTKPLIVYGFGKPQVQVWGTSVNDWRTNKACELLFFLLDQARPVTKEAIIDALWPDQLSSQLDNLFRLTLHRLRKATSAEWIKREGATYLLNAPYYWYDVQQFRELVIQGNRQIASSPEAASQSYQAALSLYRGDFLSSFYSDWIITRQEELSNLYLETLLKQAELTFQLNQLAESLQLLNTCLDHDPCNEAAQLLRMKVYARMGNFVMVTHCYRLYCQTLEKELKLKPNSQFQQAYLNLLPYPAV